MRPAALLLNEDEVIDLACTFLESRHWKIIQRLKGRARGVDIIAERAGKRLLVEAKGCTTGDARERELQIQQHRTNASLAAVGKLVYLYDGASLLALALPDDPVFRAGMETGRRGLERLGAGVIWVRPDHARTWNADSFDGPGGPGLPGTQCKV